MLMCLLMQCIVFVLFYNSLGVCGKPPRTNYIHPISKDKYNLILSFVKSEGKCDIPVKERTRQYRSAYVYYWRHKDKLTLGMSFICFFEFVYPCYCVFDVPGIFMIFDVICPIGCLLGYPS